MGKERNSDQWFALWALLGLCAAAALGVTIWIGVDLTLRNSGSPNPAPSIVHPSSPVSSNVIPRDPAARRAELAMIPAPGTRPAMAPTVSGPRVSLAISPVLIQGSATSDPMRIAMHPSLAPPAGVKPATEPVDNSTLVPGTYAYAVNLELQRRFVMSMCTDQQGNLWVGTEGGGVQRFDPSAPKYQQWTQYTTKNGLGDDNGYAVACDQQNRIWAGHLNHGVSVFNGQKWQNYEVVAGLSRPDTLAGPLGERIFHITVCPADGDVWMASSCGLARYSIKNDAWSYITRADGLPSDQANSIAFDPQGNIYVATQCDGIAMADASDNYKHWRQVTGPDEEPTQPTGDGLPTNLMNDILVAKDGTVYAATDVGLAWSKDNGITWKYVRGKDWAEKVRRSAAGPPPGWTETPGAVLAEDYCTCLGEDRDRVIIVGHRSASLDVATGEVKPGTSIGGSTFARAVLPGLVGGVGNGVEISEQDASQPWKVAQRAQGEIREMPNGSEPPDPARLSQFEAELSSLKAESTERISAFPEAIFLADDWMTEGDWVHHYGGQYGLLCGAEGISDDLVSWNPNYTIRGEIGPHHNGNDRLRGWIFSPTSVDRRTLYNPAIGCRRQSDWDDHGEAYAITWNGPDIINKVNLPSGVFDVTCYFVNENGKSALPIGRDYLIEMRPTATQNRDTNHRTVRARVRDFYFGVYKRFRLAGPGDYELIIHRNNSINTVVSGIFIDRVGWPSTSKNSKVSLGPYGDNNLLGAQFFPGDSYQETVGVPITSETTLAANRLWEAITRSYEWRPINFLEQAFRVQAYRAVAAEQPRALGLSAWRWESHLWSDRESDRLSFDNAMNHAWESRQHQSGAGAAR